MVYFLKTSKICNNNCIYCHLLNKKNDREKSLNEIKREIKNLKELGYKSIKLPCNTDIRKDFIDVLRLIKKYGIKIILETNGRMFYYPDFFKKIDKYIDQYELYLSFFDLRLSEDIIGVKNAYKQSIIGIKNISDFTKNKNIIAKIVLIRDNPFLLLRIIDQIKQLKIKKIKFVYPLQQHQNDMVLSLVEVVPEIIYAKNYAEENGIKVLTDGTLEYNPYLPQNHAFFDTKKAKLEVNYSKYKDKPEFSVIIPTYNRKNNLKFVLNNFFNQDYQKSKYEVIVIDDGSQDNTLAMVKKLKPTCNFKYFYWPRTKVKKNKWSKFYNRAGLSRNIGIDNSEGEIILFNDSDILVEKDCLKKHERYHQEHQNIIVRGFRMYLPKSSRDLDKSEPEKTERGIRLHCRTYDLSKEGWQRVITANLSLRKEYLEKIGGFDRNFSFWGSEDIDLGHRLSKLKMKLVWDNKIKVYHLWHPKYSDIDRLTLLWLGDNLLYRKYLDENIVNLHARDAILCHLDKLL